MLSCNFAILYRAEQWMRCFCDDLKFFRCDKIPTGLWLFVRLLIFSINFEIEDHCLKVSTQLAN